MELFCAQTSPVPEPFSWSGSLDEAAHWFINYFVAAKFYIIFSFLFGMSFFIQMDRAAEKGVDFCFRFFWRLVLLLVGLACFFMLGGVQLGVVAYKSLSIPEPTVVQLQEQPHPQRARSYEASSFGETAHRNLTSGLERKLNYQVKSGRIFMTMGLFIIFYGFGLGLNNYLGVFPAILLCAGYTLLQIWGSSLWLKNFRFGPLEWLWRSGTYLRWQPLRRI